MYLNCKTFFSFKYGTFTTEELVKAAAERGVDTLALTNINNTCDTWDFVDFCRQQDIKPVVGAEIRNDHNFLYILLARNNQGFRLINTFISKHLAENIPFPERPQFGTDVFIIYPLGKFSPAILNEQEKIAVQSTEINLLYGNLAKQHPQKLVIRQPVSFQNRTYYQVHRLLRAIDQNILLSKQQPEQIAGTHEMFVTPDELFRSFKQYPQLITNTLQLMELCSIEIELHTDKTKKIYAATRKDDKELLEKLAWDGFRKRYSDNPVAEARVLKELRIIDELGFNAYFLITWDIIRYAKSRGFFYVGRGSGANSIVAYCLQITDVDPIELDLYFERFLNPYRATPPDFDIDFSYRDRDEVIDYIFKRYGKEHVCLLGAYNTFQPRAIIRELGKVFGLPKEEIDRLEAGNLSADPIQRSIYQYGKLIKDFPSHLSIHAGGMLISDEPIFSYTATALPPKGFYTSQIDMFVAEKIGLFKLDILSQRGLGHIKETMEIVKANRGIDIDIHAIDTFKSDPRVADQIRQADTIGCFYIESPAMRQLLKKLRCDDYITLVAASSIIRPGVSQSGMMRQYIYRFHNPDKFTYLHPIMEEHLKETYGVMVYQEDVIKIAHHFGKLDMGEADVLRRAMSGKYRGHQHFEKIKAEFFSNCKNEGYPDDITLEVWRQIESFGGYSFSKAHSASFAVESYQSLYLKTYFPVEFMVSVINNFGGFYSRELYFHELSKTGAQIHLPCVNTGLYYTSVKGMEVTVGFVHVNGLETSLITQLISERKKRGGYKDLQDFIGRLQPGIEQLNLLIRIGAFRFTGKQKKELLWEANFFQKKNQPVLATPKLFIEKPVAFTLPVLPKYELDDAFDEIELMGFAISKNMFELLNGSGTDYTPANNMEKMTGQQVAMLGYWVTTKPVRTARKETMFFHTFIDAAGNWIDTVFFPPAALRFKVQGNGFYHLEGRILDEFGVATLDVSYCRKLGLKENNELIC